MANRIEDFEKFRAEMNDGTLTCGHPILCKFIPQFSCRRNPQCWSLDLLTPAKKVIG